METIRKTIYDIDLAKQLQRIYSGVMLAKNDKKANRMGANVFQDGQAVNLSGYTVKGYFIRSGVETLDLTGAIDGNTAYVDLDAKCYHRDGSFSLSIVLCRDGKEQTLVIFDGRVLCTCTDTVVENENTLSLADIAQKEWVQNVLNAADTAMEQAGKAAASAVEAQNILDEATAEAKAIVDSIPPDYSETVAELSKKAPAIFVDASGDMVHITDGAAMPVQSLVTHIAPVQEGEGDPSPDNVRPISGRDSVTAQRTGKNMLPGGMFAFTGVNRIYFEPHLKPGMYTLAATVESADTDTTRSTAFFYKVSEGKAVEQGRIQFERGVRASQTLNLPNGADYVMFCAATTNSNSTGDSCTWTDVQLECAESATPYEPHNGQTMTAALPETVYGGTLNWTTGVLTVTHKKETITRMSATHSNAGEGYLAASVSKPDMKSDSRDNGLCETMKSVRSQVGATSNCIVFGASNQTLYIAISTELAGTTRDSLNAYLAENPLTVVYPLAEPYTIQLTPQQLETLKGTNNIWSDAGATEVTYVADTKLYIDQKIAAIAAAIV